MNIRLFSMAVLVSALPLFASELSLNKGDFISAERVTRSGETIVSVKLSKSGKAKFKKLNASSVNKEIHAEIAGVESNFKLRVPITGAGLEMGPYSENDAVKVVTEINKR
ncbi:MAG: hypothetical protein A2X86_09405 [Bdellovibrionales bacterium GWA2_49_15]|nr:MAG: hypothetical protein A2X86_09405 [Bdellovibrionales bacterium GWA2_49_15]HAZ12995.1 hypothetical protein [Bdellovibrionales bacterium]